MTPPASFTSVSSFTLVGFTVNTSNQINGVNTQNLDIGMQVTGTGIPANTTIIAIGPVPNQITISANATATSPGRWHVFDVHDGCAECSRFDDVAQQFICDGAVDRQFGRWHARQRRGLPGGAKITQLVNDTTISISPAFASATNSGVTLAFMGGNTTFTEHCADADFDRRVGRGHVNHRPPASRPVRRSWRS